MKMGGGVKKEMHMCSAAVAWSLGLSIEAALCTVSSQSVKCVCVCLKPVCNVSVSLGCVSSHSVRACLHEMMMRGVSVLMTLLCCKQSLEI